MKNILTVALIVVVASSGLMATDIWVQAGNNTITAALATAEAGDRLVLVEEGVYSNDPLFVYKPVTIKAFDGLENKPVVSFLWSDDATIIEGQEKTLAFTYASLTLEGLEFTMEGDPALTDGITTRMFRNRAYTGVNWEFNDCLFRDASQATMSITGVLDTFLLADGSEFIDGVDFVDNEGVVIDGVTVAQDGLWGVLDTLIIDNSVFNNFNDGNGGPKINHIPSHGRGVYSYAQFTNNTVSNTDHHTIQVAMRDVNEGSDVSLYGTAIFDHNTIHGVGGSNKKGIFFKYVGPGSSIMNTTLSEVSGQVINVLNSEPVLVDYSNWYNTGNPVNQYTDGGHNLQVDPLFADASANDFTLPETSPLVGAGSNGSTIGDPRWAPTISGNLAPVAVAGADIVIESDDGSETVTLDGSASYDPNGDALTYSWTLDGTVVSTDVSFSYDLNLGDYTFTLTVSDGEFTSSDDVIVSVIDPIQYAPVADAGDNIVVTSDGGSVTVTLDGSGSYDANGDAITYSWTLDGTVVSTDVSFNYDLDIGVYTFTLTVSDGELTDSDDVTVTVNSPPSEGDNVAISFTAANEDYVDLGDDSELQLGDHNLTIEFSLKTIAGASIVQRIIGNGGTMASDDGYSVKILSNGKLRADVSDGTTVDGKQTNALVNDGEWHKCMVMLDRDNPNGQKLWLCVDGACNTKIINSSIGSCANTNDTFVLGRKSTTSANDSFTGSLDEVRIWNTALTDTANVSLWRDGELTSLHPNISDLQAYYKFNENSGSTANDLTADYLGSYESDGTITGAEWVASDIPNFTLYDDEDLQEETIGVDVSVSNNAGWNLVGLPAGVEDASQLSVYPDGTGGTLYSYDGTYVGEDALVPGEGYWLHFPDVGSTTITGTPISSLTVSLTAGWNLISGISETTDVSAISDPGGIIVAGTIYEFTGVYANASVLTPGHGYWVNASADGDITISSGSAAKTIVSFTDRTKEANILSFNGNDLYFGVSIPEEEMLSYQLPPKPPIGAFDVRFADNMKVSETEGAIEVMNNIDRLTISYTINIKAEEHMRWVLASDEGKEYELNGSGEIVVNGDVTGFTLKKAPEIPLGYSLSQNYPNPFNPVTSISFEIPKESFLTISVYNLLGHKVTDLVSDMHPAGYHNVMWNSMDMSGKPVSSGVYIYTIQADDFRAVKKMLLIK